MRSSSSCSNTRETSSRQVRREEETPAGETPILLMKGRRSGGVPDAVATPSNNPKYVFNSKKAKCTALNEC